MTAIRETFEETGLLLAMSSGSPPSDAILDAARESIHTGKTLFRDFLRRYSLVADVETLLPFTEWVTPPGPHPYVAARTFVPRTPTTACNTAASTRDSTSPFYPRSARPASPPAPRSTAFPPRMADKKSSKHDSYTYTTRLQNTLQRR